MPDPAGRLGVLTVDACRILALLLKSGVVEDRQSLRTMAKAPER
jgi:hypothetical protein